MKIDFKNVKDLYKPTEKAIDKGNNKFFCITCKKTLDKKNFFQTRRLDKHPTGVIPECKTCITMKVDDLDPATFLPILKEIDVPYLPIDWRKQVAKKLPTSPSIIGKYLSYIRLNQHKRETWADTERLVEEETESLLSALRQQYDTETEAQEQLKVTLEMSDIQPAQSKSMVTEPNISTLYGLTPETSKYGLTQEEIDDLKSTWGEDYTEDQYFKLEQMFQDMKNAYIIQDPIAISNAQMICKLTIKMNKYLDIDDMESVSKIGRQLDTFTKTANLAPVQQKDRQQATFAISQLAYLIEKDGGFIPEYYIDKPKDKLDAILKDMEEYTAFLIHGEPNIEEMVTNAAAILSQDLLPDAEEDDDFAKFEEELLQDMANIEEAQNAFSD